MWPSTQLVMNEIQSLSTDAACFAYNTAECTLVLMNGSNLLCKKDNREQGGIIRKFISPQFPETFLIAITDLLKAIMFRNIKSEVTMITI
jgi:hypothetical protein